MGKVSGCINKTGQESLITKLKEQDNSSLAERKLMIANTKKKRQSNAWNDEGLICVISLQKKGHVKIKTMTGNDDGQ